MYNIESYVALSPKFIEKIPFRRMESPLLRVLSAPETTVHLEPQEMELMIRQARMTNLLGVLAHKLSDCGVFAVLPRQVQAHFTAAQIECSVYERMLDWETEQVRIVLNNAGIVPILLKGAAYRALGLPTAAGRIASDVDILVHEAQLTKTEATLKSGGWKEIKGDDYDQTYYREWMHELPPLRHRLRGTVVDVHRTIIPRTARLKPDPEKLVDAAITLPEGNLRVLCPEDMLLHNVVHHFYNGEFDNSLRELVDLDGLLREFAGDDGFWDRLVPRTQDLDLIRPLYYGLSFTQRLLGTPIPGDVMRRVEAGRPNALVRLSMGSLVSTVLTPTIPGHSDLPRTVAAWLLYLRSHWLRMPSGLLVRHLAAKTWMRLRPASAET